MPSSRRQFMVGMFAATAHPAWCQEQNIIRAEASLVLVPVTVLDHTGKAVQGLSKDDFSVTVDGVATKIAAFDAHVDASRGDGKGPGRESPQNDAGRSPTQPPQGITNVPAEIDTQNTTVILLMDYLNTDLQDRLTMRETALRFFAERLRPGEIYAVFGLSYRLIPLLPPSADPDALVRAAKTTLGQINAPDPPESGVLSMGKGGGGTDAAIEYFKLRSARQNFLRDQRTRAIRTLEAFRQLARAFAGVPGRKELLWLTGDASPLNPSMLYLILHGDPRLEANIAPGAGLAQTFESLNNANIAVFPIDVRGVRNTAFSNLSKEMSHVEFNQARRGTQPEEVNIYSGSTDRRQGEAANSVLAMETCARETGGEVLRGNNDLESLLWRARGTWNAYYVLSFLPPAAGSRQGRYVPIKVKVNKKHVRVLHRQGFWLGSKAHVDQQAAISDAITTDIDATEIPLRLVARHVENGEIPFSLFVTLTSDSFDPVQRNFSLIIVVLTMDESGKIVSRHGESLAGTVDSRQQETLIERGSEYRSSFPLARATTGRVIVLDNLAGRLGSVTVPKLGQT